VVFGKKFEILQSKLLRATDFLSMISVFADSEEEEKGKKCQFSRCFLSPIGRSSRRLVDVVRDG